MDLYLNYKFEFFCVINYSSNYTMVDNNTGGWKLFLKIISSPSRYEKNKQ